MILIAQCLLVPLLGSAIWAGAKAVRQTLAGLRGA